jgi:hypothetical protein
MSRQDQLPDSPFVEPAPPPDAVETFVPYKNGKALAAYYCGVFSLLPIIGMPLGIVAFVLGIMGLRAAKRDPRIRGKAHAWVGIIMGGICGFAWTALVVLSIVGMVIAALA